MINLTKSEFARKKLLKKLLNEKVKLVVICVICAIFISYFINLKFQKTIPIFILCLICGYFAYKKLEKFLKIKFEKELDKILIDTFFIPFCKNYNLVYLPKTTLDFETLARSELLSKDINFICSNGAMNYKNESLNFIKIYENYSFKKQKFSILNSFKNIKTERILHDGILLYNNFEIVSKTRFFVLPKGEIPQNTKKFYQNFENFSEIYDVFTNDEEFAKDILDEKFCQFCLKVCEDYAVCLKLSFIFGRIYIFVDCGEILADLDENLNKNIQLLSLNEIFSNFSDLNFKISQTNIWQDVIKEPEIEDILNIAKTNSWEKLL